MNARSSFKGISIVFAALLAPGVSAPVPGRDPNHDGGVPYDLVPRYGKDGERLSDAAAIEALTRGTVKRARGLNLRSQNMHLMGSSSQTSFVNSDRAFLDTLAFAGPIRLIWVNWTHR